MSDKLQLVLDLDETLINYVERPVWQGLSESEQNKYKVVSDSIDSGVFVIRPHVQELLDFAFANCLVSIWTWASEDYALEVATILSGGAPQKFENIWAETDSNNAFSIYKQGKDLRHLWHKLAYNKMTLRNTILVDDLETNTNHYSNKYNSIQVPSFELFPEKSNKYTDLSSDKALLNVINVLKEVLADKLFCKYDMLNPFTSFQKVSSSLNGGRRKQRTLKQKKVKRSRVINNKNL